MGVILIYREKGGGDTSLGKGKSMSKGVEMGMMNVEGEKWSHLELGGGSRSSEG